MFRRVCLTFAILLLGHGSARAGDRWTKVLEKSGISVYSKPFAKANLLGFRGIVDIPAPPRKVLAVLMDNKRKREWIWGLQQSRVLRTTSKHDMVVYQAFRLSSLISDRDFVFRGRVTRDKKSSWIHLECVSVKDPKAPKSVGVRGQLHRNNFTLIPIHGGQQTRVIMDCVGDPKGWIPQWLVDRTLKNWPIEILWGLRAQSNKSGYGLYPEPPLKKSP